MKKNKVERESTTSAVRGFSTDQRISIEQLNIQNESMLNRKNDRMLERVMISLSIEMNVIGAQVEAAENRATLRCPKYNKKICFGKK